MITFDKLKIVTKIKDITEIDTTVFVTQTKDGKILYYKYKQESPFSLMIQADLNNQELVIEFTGEPTLKSKACLKCLYFTKIISDLCRNLEYFSYLYTIN